MFRWYRYWLNLNHDSCVGSLAFLIPGLSTYLLSVEDDIFIRRLCLAFLRIPATGVSHTGPYNLYGFYLHFLKLNIKNYSKKLLKTESRSLFPESNQ
jgi:hypothetical protein